MDIILTLTEASVFLAGSALAFGGWSLKNQYLTSDTPDQFSSEATPLMHVMSPFVQILTRWNKKINNKQFNSYLESVKKKITMAGRPFGLQPMDFIAFQELSMVAFAFMGGFALATINHLNLFTFLALAATGLILPLFWLSETINARHKHILRALPYTTDLLTLCVEAGLDFMGAVNIVVEKGGRGPLQRELFHVLQEIKIGATRREALENMATRINLSSINAFVSSLVQADKLGTPLGEALRIQSEQRRTERFQRAEKMAQEAPVKLLFPLLIFIFPAVFIVLFGPIVLKWMYEGGM